MTMLIPIKPPGRASQLRVALFSGNYNYTRDGANRALNKLAERLIDRGATVRIYSPTTARPAFEPTGTLVSVPSIAIPGRPDFRMALGLPRHVREDVDRFSPNIVHVSAPDFLGVSAQYHAKKRGLPIIASFHTRFESYLEYYRMGFLGPIVRERQARFYRNSNRVLAPNGAIVDDLLTMGVTQNAIRTWSRGVCRRQFSPAHRDLNWRRANGLADSDVIVTFLGRLVAEKGIQLFASAMNVLARRGCRVQPLIIGSGPAEETFRKLLPHARFIGHLDGVELGTALASSDILLNPSKTEAFGNVVLEAMASGIPVVSPAVRSAQALITDRHDGVLVDGRTTVLATGVQWLAENPGVRRTIGEEAQRTAAFHNWNIVNDQAIDTYLELMNETQKPERMSL